MNDTEKEIRERCEKLDKAKELIYEAIKNIADATAGTKQADTAKVLTKNIAQFANGSGNYTILSITIKLLEQFRQSYYR